MGAVFMLTISILLQLITIYYVMVFSIFMNIDESTGRDLELSLSFDLLILPKLMTDM